MAKNKREIENLSKAYHEDASWNDSIFFLVEQLKKIKEKQGKKKKNDCDLIIAALLDMLEESM